MKVEGRTKLLKNVGGLCNGSTTDFDSVSLGSIPSPPAKFWGIGIIGNTVALQVTVSGSIPLSSTKFRIHTANPFRFMRIVVGSNPTFASRQIRSTVEQRPNKPSIKCILFIHILLV